MISSENRLPTFGIMPNLRQQAGPSGPAFFVWRVGEAAKRGGQNSWRRDFSQRLPVRSRPDPVSQPEGATPHWPWFWRPGEARSEDLAFARPRLVSPGGFTLRTIEGLSRPSWLHRSAVGVRTLSAVPYDSAPFFRKQACRRTGPYGPQEIQRSAPPFGEATRRRL